MTRRRRSPSSYARRGPEREPYDLVLIVCEGEKTEPNYFRGLIRAQGLSNANIHVRSPNASDPSSLVAYALEKLRNGDYDRAFCVFDRDSHAGFDDALERIARSTEGQTGKVEAIVSWPCFEVWVLLHFVMTTSPFTAGGGRSACENVIREIGRHFPNYAKGDKGIYDALSAQLELALNNAASLSRHNRDTTSDNPGTGVHKLVSYLMRLDQPS